MENQTVNATPEVEVEEKTYTEKELQSYADRRVSEALKTAKGKWDIEKKEADRLASLSQEERFKEEMQKRENELAERERQVALLENRNAALSILADKGISPALVDLVISESADDIKNKIDILDKEFQASVQKEVEKRLIGSGNTPKVASNGNNMTKEQFRQMSIQKQQELFKTNPDLYKQIWSN